MPKSLADWASVISFVIAVISIFVAWRQRNKLQHQTETLVTFLLGLKPAIQGDNQKFVIEQINDILERLNPPKK